MSLAQLFLRNHAKLALPAFLGGSLLGLGYTLQTGRAPLSDFSAWLAGEPALHACLRCAAAAAWPGKVPSDEETRFRERRSTQSLAAAGAAVVSPAHGSLTALHADLAFLA